MLPYHQSHCANSLGPEQYIFHILIRSIAVRMVSGASWCSTSIYWTHINNQFFLVGQNETYKEIILMSFSILKFPSKKISEYLSYAPLCVEWNLQKVSAGIQQTFIEYLVKMKNLKRLVFGVSFLQLERLTSSKNKILLACNSNYLATMKRISLVRCVCMCVPRKFWEKNRFLEGLVSGPRLIPYGDNYFILYPRALSR